MEFNYRPTDHAPPPLTFTPPPPPLNFSYFPHQHLPGHGGWGYNGSYHLEGPNSAIEMSELMRREMEKGMIREEVMMETAWRQIQKERIREEILVDEIMTRRLLEAEVRMELSIERELALQRGGDLFIGPRGFPAPVLPFEVGGRSIEERFMTSLGGRPAFGGLEQGLQMSVDPHIFVAKPPLGNGEPKEKIILPARPLQDVNVPVLSAAGSTKKQLREEWSCALCHVTALSEQGLNEHLQGKRHKAKEAGLGKKGTIGWFTEKTKLVSSKDAPLSSSKLSNKSDQNIVKYAESGSPSQDLNNAKRKDYQFDGVRQNSPGNKNLCKFWCETCQVGMATLKSMEEHSTRRKHLSKLQKSNQNTQVMQVIQELIITETDGNNNGENSASEDSGAVVLKVDLEKQLEEEANVGAETSSENPEKSDDPIAIVSQHLDDSVQHIDLEAQREEEGNVGAETSSENSEKSGDPIVIISQHLDNSVQQSGSPIAIKQEHTNLLRFWCEMCQIGTHSEKLMEDHRTGRKHLARLQKSNLNTQVIQVGEEWSVTKKDGNHCETSESEAYKDELEDQQEKEANVGAETSLENPEKSGDPVVIISQHLDDSVQHIELEAQLEEESNVGAETSSENSEKSGDPIVIISQHLDNSVQQSGSPIARKQEHINLLSFWCEMCQIGTHSEILMEDHRTGRRHRARLQKSNLNIQVIQVGQELTATKKDGNDCENSESEAHKVELEDQQEKEANVNAETSSDTPKKSGDPLVTVSQQLEDSVRNRRKTVVRTQEHKKNWSRFWCGVCQIGTDTEKDMEIHRTGKKHLAHKKNLCRFWCDACQLGTDTEKDMVIHRTGKKHISRLQNIDQNHGDEYPNFVRRPVQDAEANSQHTKNSCNLLKNKSQLLDVCMKNKEAPVWRMKETQGLKK